MRAPPGPRFRPASGPAARPGRRWPAGSSGVGDQRRALQGPRQPWPSSGKIGTSRKGRNAVPPRRNKKSRVQVGPRGERLSAPGARLRPLGPRRARGALGAVAAHAPSATARRRGFLAARGWGKGLRGVLSRERAARCLAAEGLRREEGCAGCRGGTQQGLSCQWDRDGETEQGWGARVFPLGSGSGTTGEGALPRKEAPWSGDSFVRRGSPVSWRRDRGPCGCESGGGNLGLTAGVWGARCGEQRPLREDCAVFTTPGAAGGVALRFGDSYCPGVWGSRRA